MKYPLTQSNWDKKEISAMQKVIKSGMFTMGKNVFLIQTNRADTSKRVDH